MMFSELWWLQINYLGLSQGQWFVINDILKWREGCWPLLIGWIDLWTVAAGGTRHAAVNLNLVLGRWPEHPERQRPLQPHTLAAQPKQQPSKPRAAEPLRQVRAVLSVAAIRVAAAEAQGHVDVRVDGHGQVAWREPHDGGQAGPAGGRRGLRHPQVVRVQTPAAVSLDTQQQQQCVWQ